MPSPLLLLFLYKNKDKVFIVFFFSFFGEVIDNFFCARNANKSGVLPIGADDCRAIVSGWSYSAVSDDI